MQDEKRIVDLEIKIAHAERTIEDLSDVLYKQQVQIQKLEKDLALISKKMQGSQELEIGPANEKPPHY